MVITNPRQESPNGSKSCPSAFPESSDDEFQITPENPPSTVTIKGYTCFPSLTIEVPSTWPTMNEDLSDYFWRNCSYGPKSYGFPKQAQQKPSKPKTTTSFVQKASFAKHGHKFVPGHSDVEQFMVMSTEELVQEAWKRLGCDVDQKQLKTRPRVETITEKTKSPEAKSQNLSKDVYELPELPTYRRHFKPEAPYIAERQRPKWFELGHEENLDFFPPDHNLKGPYQKGLSEEYSDIEVFQHMSTEELVELNWDRLSIEKYDSDDSESSENDNPDEDMSELDAYFDYHSTNYIPEIIPRMVIRFHRGSYDINYEPARPRVQLKTPEKPPSVILQILLYIYSIISSLFFQPIKEEELPIELPTVLEEPILELKQQLQVTISNMPKNDLSCKFLEKLEKPMICAMEIKLTAVKSSILINISHGVRRKLMFIGGIGQNPEDHQNQVIISIDIANFSMEKVNVARKLHHEETSIVISISGETDEELDVKFITDAGDVLFDRTVLALSTPEGNTCEVVRRSVLEELELPVETPEEAQKVWLDNLPEELTSELKEESKFIEVAFRNPIDLTRVNCFCTNEEHPKILLKLPARFFKEIRYRISDGQNTVDKLMTYSFGDYRLEEQNPWICSIGIDITLRNLSLNDFDHFWERYNKFGPTPEDFFMLKHKQKARINVFFKDDIGNYKIDDISPSLPMKFDNEYPRKKLTVNLKNTLYKTSGTFSMTRTPPYALTCEVHHTLYDIIEPIRVTINDGRSFKEFFMLDEEDEVPDPYQKLIEIELSNGLTMGDISYSAMTSGVNETHTSTLKLVISPKIRVPIVVDVTDELNTDRCIIDKSSNVDCKVKEMKKTVYVMMRDGLSLENVKFLVLNPLKVDGIWETNIFVSISEDSRDDLVVWLVVAKEFKKMTINRKEPKHLIKQETSHKSGGIEPNSAQANLLIFLKKIPLANTSIISKQYDKNSSNNTIILTIFTKASTPIKLTTKVEDLTPEEHIFFERIPRITRITTSMQVRIIKGLYLRDLEVSAKEVMIDDQWKGQEVLIKVQNPRGCCIVMSINYAITDTLMINADDITKAELEPKEIGLFISEDLRGCMVSHFWEAPRVLEQAMVFKITFACATKIRIRTFPLRFSMGEPEDRLEELNLKVVDKLRRFEELGQCDDREKEKEGVPVVSADDDAIDVFKRYSPGDEDFYRRLFYIYEGWKFEFINREEPKDVDTEVSDFVAKNYKRGLPIVGFLVPDLTFSGLTEMKNAQSYQRCDMVYARYLGQYYKECQSGAQQEYWDYSSGDEDDVELEEDGIEEVEDQEKLEERYAANEDGGYQQNPSPLAPNTVEDEILPKDNKDTPTMPICVPSVNTDKLQE